jgi:uncharacterized protein YjbI with pentapeptide repeats
MADEQQLAVLRQGREAWNAWREQNPDVGADLSGADLSGAKLSGADLYEAKLLRADLSGADLAEADLSKTDLSGANLSSANLSGAPLNGANLAEADLTGADISRSTLVGTNLAKACLIGAELSRSYLIHTSLVMANLSGAQLFRAHLSGSDLSGASLAEANLIEANLNGCRVCGISAWNLTLDGAEQTHLIVTPPHEPEVTVDGLELAQFIYLLLTSERVRHLIDAIASNVVLILGELEPPERDYGLDDLRNGLRRCNYTPVHVDLDQRPSKERTGAIQILANMARFIIADVTEPSRVAHELAMVVPNTPIPVQLVVLEGQREHATLADLRRRYPWVLEPYCYDSPEEMADDLHEQVIVPAEATARKLRRVLPPTG